MLDYDTTPIITPRSYYARLLESYRSGPRVSARVEGYSTDNKNSIYQQILKYMCPRDDFDVKIADNGVFLFPK